MDSIKEVLKKVLSDDFIKECAEDFTKDGIEQLTGTMLGAVTKTFFEKWNYCRALTQAEKEGTGANQKQLKEFIENWKSDSSVYSEDELNDMFERTYQELQKNSENFCRRTDGIRTNSQPFRRQRTGFRDRDCFRNHHRSSF